MVFPCVLGYASCGFTVCTGLHFLRFYGVRGSDGVSIAYSSAGFAWCAGLTLLLLEGAQRVCSFICLQSFGFIV